MDSALSDAGFGIQFIQATLRVVQFRPHLWSKTPVKAAGIEQIEEKAQASHADASVEQMSDGDTQAMENAAPAPMEATDIPHDSKTSADVSEEAIPTPEPAGG